MAPRKNFTTEEDLFLAMCFVQVSQDPIKGCDQKAETFWAAVHEAFQNLCSTKGKDPQSGAAKNVLSVWNRFKRKIAKDVVAYNGILKTMDHLSGESDEDFIERAKQRFNERQGHKFKFSHCLDVLAAMPKFSLEETGTDESGLLTANESVYSFVKQVRPQGNKSAKREVKDEAIKENYNDKKIKVLTGINDAMNKVADSAMMLAANIKEANLKEWYMCLIKVHNDLGDLNAVNQCLAELRGMNPAASAVPQEKTGGDIASPIEVDEGIPRAIEVTGGADKDNYNSDTSSDI